jgi:diguanylate cyclase (GGDEF)-like protein
VDELTGLPNRRRCSASVERLVAADEPAVALALLDLDRFKAVNDSLGHAGGDALLRAAATAWRGALPASAEQGLHRWGGEEFVLLLRGDDASRAAALLRDVRLATPVPHTVSAGLVVRRPGEGAADLLARADALLYRAKEAGRDRVCSDAEEQDDDAGAPRRSAPASSSPS